MVQTWSPGKVSLSMAFAYILQILISAAWKLGTQFRSYCWRFHCTSGHTPKRKLHFRKTSFGFLVNRAVVFQKTGPRSKYIF